MNNSSTYQGSSRKNRLQKALSSSYFLPDERSMGDFLRFIYHQAHLLSYYDLDSEKRETWQRFFEHDDAFLLAEIAGLNIADIEKEKINILNSFEGYDELLAKISQFERFFVFCLDLLKILNRWYVRAAESNKGIHATDIEKELYAAILGEGNTLLSKLIAYDMAKISSDLPITMQNDYAVFAPIWKIDETEPISIYHIGNNEIEQISHAIKEVIFIYPPIISIMMGLNQKAPALFANAFYENDNHPPHHGLLFTFLTLYQILQADINKLTHKHLDYFYTNILGQKPALGRPDTLYICGFIQPDYKEVYLEKDTLLHAGQNALGHPEKYAIDQSIQMTQAKITRLLSLYVSRNPLVDVYSQFRLVSGIYGREMEDIRQMEPFASLGEEQLFLSEEERSMKDISIGFAISSPTLRLSSGHRMISVSFYFSPASIDGLTFLLLDIADKRQIKPEDVFHEIFAYGFSIGLTGENGWISPSNYQMLPPGDWTKDPILLTFILDEAMPAIIPFNETIHTGSYKTDQPILRLMIKGGLTTHPYAYLENMQINEIEIAVKVDKFKQVKLFNHLGAIDASSPYPLLGPMPGIGSYFIIGSAELFTKDITDLTIELSYQPMALDGGNFVTHYEGYNKNINAQSFTIGISALSNYRFNPEKWQDAQNFCLFQNEPSNGIPENTLIHSMDMSKLQIQPNYKLAEETINNYQNDKQTGFLKFTLSNPPMGFGYDIYPKIFVRAISENAKPNTLLSGEKTQLPIPNNPIHPVVSDISISYSAHSKLQFDERKLYENNPAKDEKCYHLHPFGLENIFSEGKPKKKKIIPSLPDEGYLFIGLDQLILPQQLHLLIQMKRSEQWEIGHKPEVKWQYLAREGWTDFDAGSILSDGTRNLMVTGIISFELPMGMSNQHDIITGNYYWIRAVCRQKADLHSRIIQIHTNATSATYQYDENTMNHPVSIPDGSITEPVKPIPGLQSLFQPLASTNGTTKESEVIFHTRVAERIRHKNRCLTRWDIEHMLLNRFDELNQVKCIGYNGHENFIAKGEITIVAIPKVNGEKQFYEPKLNPELMEEIRDFIQEYTSPFLKLDIRNPSFEYIRLKAKIIFDGKSPGRYLRTLQQDLLQFICPWFYDDNVDASLGGSIKKSSLIHFVESRPYVKFLTGLSVIQLQVNDNGLYLLKDTAADVGSTDSLLKGGTPWSVLIPSFSNDIEILEKPKFYAPEPANFSDFSIGNTLVVASDIPESIEEPSTIKTGTDNANRQTPISFTLHF